jgi:hypothetical protein
MGGSEASESKHDYSSTGNAHNQGYSVYDRTNHNFALLDDVTSIRTEQYKLSARDHNMLDNHLYSHSQSRESLPVVSHQSQFDNPIDSVDG